MSMSIAFAALFSAFAFDLTFDLHYAFSWPMALPSFARIHFALALGILGLQFTLNGFFRVYNVRLYTPHFD